MRKFLVRRTHGVRIPARRRLFLGLLPAVVAAGAVLTGPPAVLAADGATRTARTTYVVNTAKSQIDVTATYTIKNTTPSHVKTVDCYQYWTCTQTTSYYFDKTYFIVDFASGPIAVTSNAGKVQQAVDSETSAGRVIKLTFPPVWYGQTRTVTATYSIPAGIDAPSGYRALKSYASICAMGNVYTEVDSGTVNVVIPDGFSMLTTSGDGLTNPSQANGQKTYSTSEPHALGCLVGSNPSGLVKKSAVVGGATVNLSSWPEDTSWTTRLNDYLAADLPKLQDVTGLPLPAGSVALTEGGQMEIGVGDIGGDAPWESMAPDVTESRVMRAAGTALYGPMFTDTWMSAGVAGYAAKVNGDVGTDCVQPTDGLNLTDWQTLSLSSSSNDRMQSELQYRASCAVVAKWAETIGPARFKEALVAAYKGETPYLGAGPAESLTTAGNPITAKALLDVIDERGMVPAGVSDLDQAQDMLAHYGVFNQADLEARSQARSRYHSLVQTAAGWKMPLVVRSAMGSWDFAAAGTAMDTTTQIFSFRDQAEKAIGGLKLDGTALQKDFESATRQADLDAVLTLARSEFEAVSKVVEATQLKDGSRTVLQTVGLLGTDTTTPLRQARTGLDNVKPADASSAAQSVIDAINKSSDQGLLRLVVAVGILLAALLLLVVGLLVRRRRRRRLLPVPPTDALSAAVVAVPQPDEASLEVAGGDAVVSGGGGSFDGAVMGEDATGGDATLAPSDPPVAATHEQGEIAPPALDPPIEGPAG
jgi:hypothetical protein